MSQKDPTPVIDPVCGMDLSPFAVTSSARHQENIFNFCSDFCQKRFAAAPERFTSEPLIELHRVSKIFKTGPTETRVLQELSLRVWPGDFVAIIGASGSGKTTALNIIGLLDRPTSGRVFLKGRDVSSAKDEERAELRSKTFGFVFQQYNLIPWFSAWENVTLPSVFAHRPIDKEKVTARFKEMGLAARVDHRPAELSGGEQQRVALLRALANDPEIIIGDEPTGNLDSATGNKILDILIDLNKNRKKTLVVVTHDADIAERADQIITLKDGQVIRDHGVHKKIYTE